MSNASRLSRPNVMINDLLLNHRGLEIERLIDTDQ